MSTPDIKLLEGQALAAIESGDSADAQRFTQATGMAPDVFQGQLQAKGAGKVSEAIQAHLIASDQHQTKHAENPFEQTTLGLLERCVDLDKTHTVLDYADIAAELMGELPKLIQVLHLADQVAAGMDTMLATYGDQLPAADLRSRAANVEGLRSLLGQLGVSEPTEEAKLAPADSPSPGM